MIAFALAPLGVSANNHERLAVAYGLIFASHRLFDLCTCYHNSNNRDEHLFPSQRSDRITPACIRNLVSKYVAEAKEKRLELFNEPGYSSHSFRHSKAVHMLEAGVPLIYIRNFLGHESFQTTEIYYGKLNIMASKRQKTFISRDSASFLCYFTCHNI